MVVTNNSASKEKWEASYLHGFPQIKCNHKEKMYPLTFIDEMFNIVIDHEAYLFLERYYGYHKISIAPHHEFPIL